ncbi:MAG: hypothetical protein F6J98_02655 [Moorea sp. SIO4G2]|nr:hypothetical protein [Moorena sp. SIO4G2]
MTAREAATVLSCKHSAISRWPLATLREQRSANQREVVNKLRGASTAGWKSLLVLFIRPRVVKAPASTSSSTICSALADS